MEAIVYMLDCMVDIYSMGGVVKVRVDFKNRELEWCLGLSIQFNGHTDDKKAVRKAVMEELDIKYPRAKGFVQGITLVKE